MIYIKNNILIKINNWQDDSIHILTDFDRTLTKGNSISSWSILSNSNLLPEEYVFERQKLFDYYRPIEIDESLEFNIKNKFMIEWWKKHFDLFIKYKLSEKVVNEASLNINNMSFRDGAFEFLENMNKRNIPVIIISAGIGNFIEHFLIKNNCYFNNIYLIANFIKFKNGLAVGLLDNVIHSLNKNEALLPSKVKDLIKDRGNVILLGDSISDIKMVLDDKRDSTLKIGFLEVNVELNKDIFESEFDIVCTDNTSFKDISKKIKIIK